MSETFLDRTHLNRQADRLERALNALSLPAKVEGGQVGEQWVRYSVAPVSGTQPAQVMRAAAAVADAIGVREVRVAEQGAGFAIDVPLGRGNELRLLPLLHAVRSVPPMTAVLGMMNSGRPLLLEFNRPGTWHLKASGPAGCGKSELMRSLLISLALTTRRSDLNVLGIDIGGRELAVMESLPHSLTDLATDREFAGELILWLVGEVARRRLKSIGRPHLLLLIDDLGRLDLGRDAEIASALVELMSRGFEVGLHVVTAARQGDLLCAGLPRRGEGGLVTVTTGFDAAHDGSATPGRFEFNTGSECCQADIAWLSVRDLDTAVRLVHAGWRVGRMPVRQPLEVRS